MPPRKNAVKKEVNPLTLGAANLAKAFKGDYGAVTIDPETFLKSREHLSTGSIVIDYIIGGRPNKHGVLPCPGLPRGAVTELWGHEAAGKTTVALTAAAKTCANGGRGGGPGTVVYVDWEHSVDLGYAKTIGVPVDDFNRFQLVQPATLEQGLGVIWTMTKAGVDLVVIDRDAKRVGQLKQMGYNAVVGDFGLPDVLKEAGFERAEMILIMVPDFSTVQSALGAIGRLKAELKVDPVVVARVTDEMEVDEVKRFGASDALPSSQLMAKFAIDKIETLRDMGKEKRMRALIPDLIGGKLAIILQTNPDPDSIASGVALKRYAKAFGLDSDLIYDGVVGHLQNRALVNMLELNLHESSKIDFKKYTSFALVDVATHANCALPKDILPTIVIDHHSVPSGEVKARYIDMTFVGANSTILTNYLR